MSPLPPCRAEIRRDLLLLALASAVLFFASLGARDLWNPNEPIYGQAVAEMDARGDWLVPTVNGRVFPEKPILYYWIALTAARLMGGVSELSLRVPSAVAGVTGAVLLYLLVCPYAGRTRSRLAVALYATTYMVYWGSRTIQMDVLVMVTGIGALLAVTRVVDHGRSPWVGWSLAGAAAGLGVLAKGPVGLICPGLPALLYILVTRRPGCLRTPALAAGVAACVAVAAPWFLLLVWRGETGFVNEVLIRQNFTRFVNPWDHQAPWWYFLKYFWIDMAPWAWLVPLAVALPARDAEERRLDLLAWLWIVGLIVFFSLSQSKRSAYILPIAPAVAILSSGVAERLLDGQLGKARTRLCLALFGLFGALALAAGLLFRFRLLSSFPDLEAQGRALFALLTVGGAAILAGFAVQRRTKTMVPAAFFSLMLVLYMLASVSVLPAVDAYKSARPFCERVGAVVAPDQPLASLKFWRWRAGYRFYLEREIRNLESVDELRDYWEDQRQVFLIVEGLQLDEARQVLGDSRPWVRSRVGSKTAYLFSNRRQSPAL